MSQQKVQTKVWGQGSMLTTRWAVAAKEATVHWVPGGQNLADAMTKFLPQATRDFLFGEWTHQADKGSPMALGEDHG